MLVTHGIDETRAAVARLRHGGARVAFVPTMGALHEGHLALLDAARALAGHVVLSIFVNPLQFLPGEDLARYPRPFERDRDLAAGRGTSLLFAPPAEVMYPAGAEVRIVAGDTASRWEGAARPGHFDGVLTVVTKLLHIVMPDIAVFGQKDIQQATLVRRLVRDLDLPVEIVVHPTIRDADGLALSSRNAYLTAGERRAALAIPRALDAARAVWEAGERHAAALRQALERVLDDEPAVAPDYIAVVDPDRLAPVELAPAGTIIAIAARVGATRLLDNVILGAGQE